MGSGLLGVAIGGSILAGGAKLEEKMNKAEAFMYLVAIVTSYRDSLRQLETDLDLVDGIKEALETLGFTVKDKRKTSEYFFEGQNIYKEDE